MSYETKHSPVITRVALTDDVQSSHTFAAHMRSFTVRCQEWEELRVAWLTGETADDKKYLVMRAGDTYTEDGVYTAGQAMTIYLRAPAVSSGTTGVTVLEWT